jgi:predicted nucleotide-binding protein (sugar kinase/HSP70/actin superfamily)
VRITYPRLGDAHIYGRLLFQEIGMELVIPDHNSQIGLERGSSISPEDICLPFKLMVDNLISAWEKGADTVIMPATMGPCRLGEYGEALKVVLDRHGYKYNWILLDSISAIGLPNLKKRLVSIVEDSNCSRAEIVRALKGVYTVIKEFEKLEKKARLYSGYEKQAGKSKEIVKKCRRGLARTTSINMALKILEKGHNSIESLELDQLKEPIKIILTGEIFTCIDSFSNHNIEEKLMDMGVSFEKTISIGWWLDNTVINPLGGYFSNKRFNEYIPYRIGGYAKETVSGIYRFNKANFDGIIQILPVGCMPEIVAKSVFDGLSRDENLPVLSIVFDEMVGEAGYVTRIEAFIDMLMRRKNLNL